MKPLSPGLRILAVLLILTAAALVLGGSRRGARAARKLPLGRPKVAVVPVFGEIRDPTFVVSLLHRYQNEVQNVKAVVLAIDSPGGSVASSQEICEAIRDLQEAGIFVVAAMGDVAASGGYYVAAPADKILANAGTLTGSIGVIMENLNARRVLDKIGLEFNVVKSGEFKDAGNFTRPMTARERQLFQGIIDDVYDQFVSLVAEERKGPISSILARKRKTAAEKIGDEEIRAWIHSFADGRVFSGRQALAYGLVDELGGLDRAIRAAADLAGVEDPEIVTYREPRSFAELLTGISRSEIRGWAREALGASTRRFGLYAW